MIDRKFTHLGARLKPLDEDGFGGIDPPAEALPRKWIDVKGRVEHEALLKDPEKMASLGLDPFYEQEKLKIARLAYKEITAAIKKWEEYSGQEIRCHWDEYITVDGEGFGYYELVGDDE